MDILYINKEGVMMKKIDNFIKSYSDSDDVISSKFYVNDTKYMVIHQEVLSNIGLFNEKYIPLIKLANSDKLEKVIPSTFIKLNKDELDNLDAHVFNGNIVLVNLDKGYVYAVQLENIPKRGIEDSIQDNAMLIGSRDGFIENAKVNVSLIRNRMKCSSLVVKEHSIGKKTKEYMFVLYDKETVSKDSLDMINKKLSELDINNLTSITILGESLSTKRFVPTYTTTANPNIAVNNLLNGKIIVVVDGINQALVLPINIAYFLHGVEDVGQPFYRSIYTKGIFIIALFLCVFSLGIYTCITTYHHTQFSLVFLSSLKVGRQGVVIPLVAEIITVLFIFEFYSVVSAKSPSTMIKDVIIIVGGIIVGQSTINAGVVDVFTMVFTAISFVSAFALTNDRNVIVSLSLIRLFIILSSAVLGLFGFVISSVIVINYIYNTKSLGVPYLSPVMPLGTDDLKHITNDDTITHNKKLRFNLRRNKL